MPTPAAWQQAIRVNGFALEIDTDFDPLTHTGFLPARYQGKDAGFEFSLEQGSGGQSCVSLIWSGDANESASGIIAAACLCLMTGGTINDTESGETIPASKAIAWAKQSEAELFPSQQRRPWWRFW